MAKTELLATARSLEEVKLLLAAGADALTVGEQTYGMRLPGDLSVEQIEEAVQLARPYGAKIYVVANNIMDNDILTQLPDYMLRLSQIEVDAIVFGDPAVLIAMREAGVKLPLHWNPEMTATNHVSANYWGTKGATRAVLARELNLEQIIEFKRNTKLDVQVQVHGITNIYHSKRSLVSNYFDHQGREDDKLVGAERGLYLVEAERKDEQFPIYEDRNGTHIMSSEDLCMLENVHELLEADIDCLKIEGLLKSIEYQVTIVRAYRKAIDAWLADPQTYTFDPTWLEAVEQVQPSDRPLSYGFFYKEQVY